MPPRLSRCTLLLVSALGAMVAACGSNSAETSTGPTPVKCQVALASPSSTIGADGGAGTVNVTTTPECAWDVSTAASWLSGLSPTSGQGNGTVNFRAAPNPVPTARDGEIVVNDNRLRVSQQAAACQVTVSPSTHSVDAAGGAQQVAVSAASGCTWTAAADVSWIAFTTPATGSGDATVSFTVAQNSGGQPRVGSIVVAGQRVTVTQGSTSSAGCSYTVSLNPDVSIAAPGASHSIAVTTAAGCPWTASSSVPWITVTPVANRSGSGTVTFNVATNPGAARSGTVTVAGRTTTVTQAAAPVPCNYALGSAGASLGAAGGTGTVTVAAANGCDWTASSNAAWISVASGAAGSGNGGVTFSVAANTGPARTGTLSIAGQTFTVTQAAAAVPCSYSLASPDASIGAPGGNGSVGVSAANGCDWTASSNVPWVTVTSGPNGSGNGTVAFSVAANTGGARAGTLSIAGQTFTVNQAAAAPLPCDYTLTAADASVLAAGGTGSVGVSAGAGCNWTAVSNVPWIAVTTGSGSGTGAVAFSVAANTGAARTGTLTIAGHTFTVSQAGAPPPPCSYTLSAQDASMPATGGTGSVGVSAGSNCDWTATSNVPWVTVTSGATGSGNGSVGFSVAANTGAARTGTITIAGQTFTVNQAAAAPPPPPPPCGFSIAPPSAAIGVLGGTGTVAVTAGTGCNWTAASNANWITVTSGASGSGNGTVDFTVVANVGNARTGTITIAGQTFTVTQAALSCTYTLNPTSVTMPDTKSTSTVTVSAGAGCAWIARSNASWISVKSGTSGTANGTVTFEVTKNNNDNDRIGTLTIAGHTFTVRQRGDD